jgi:hypothetical protein
VAVHPVNARQGKVTIAVGIAAIVSGFAVQAANVQSFASQPPPQWGSNSGSATLLSAIAALVIVTGVILTIIGMIRYAQSGRHPAVVFAPTSVEHTVGSTPQADRTRTSTSDLAPVFCSSCGARISGEGRYCASCGTSTAH